MCLFLRNAKSHSFLLRTSARLDFADTLPRGLYAAEREANQIPKLAGGAEMRVKVTLACTECKQRNYDTVKDKKNTPDRLEMNKYCRFCRKHTPHKETK